MAANDYVLLKSFRGLFAGCQYLHRDSSLGDYVASCLYDDLYKLNRSASFARRVRERVAVVNAQNRTVGKTRRRGDGTFGELVPATHPLEEPGFLVARGAIATIEIGAETKILAKAMIKQIDRVIGDLVRQVDEFKRGGGTPICVGLSGRELLRVLHLIRRRQAFPHRRPQVQAPNPRSRRSSKPVTRKGSACVRRIHVPTLQGKECRAVSV